MTDRDGMSRDGAAPEATSPELLQRVERLERRVEFLRGDSDPDSIAKAQLLAETERELLSLLQEASRVEPEFAHHLGHPVVATAAQWRDTALHLGLEDAAQRTDTVLSEFLKERLEEWRAGIGSAPGGADAEQCFRELKKLSALEREALRLRPAHAPDDGDRTPLREAFLKAIAQTPPSNEQLEAWSIDLRDRAEVVITGCDEFDPREAVQHLRLVAADLDWHLRNVDVKHGLRRARLKRKHRRLIAEEQERHLQRRLVTRFGEKNVERSERIIFWLILFVLSLLSVEMLFDWSDSTLAVFTILDAAACVVFLTEIAIKIYFVKNRWLWISRHFLVDILPSIPFGLLLWDARFNNAQALRAARLLRIGRILRFVRAFGFLSRGVDRLARSYSFLLNKNLLLYPTRAERAKARRETRGLDVRLRKVEAHLNDRWERLLTTAPEPVRGEVATVRADGWASVHRDGLTRLARPHEAFETPKSDIPAETVLRHLAGITAEEVEAEMGPDFVERVGRAVRLFQPMRWLPFMGRFVPRISAGMTPAELTAAAARQFTRTFKRYHDRWFWFADLYGTVTPAQFVDRVGTAIVKSTFRPAYRLALFGLLYFLMSLLVPDAPKETTADTGTKTPIIAPENGSAPLAEPPPIPPAAPGMLRQAFRALNGIVTGLLIYLGSICVVLLGIGLWLRRVAGQATAFYAQSAKAQFLALTESIKGRNLERDANVMDRRVLALEVPMQDNLRECTAEQRRGLFADGVRRWLLQAQSGQANGDGFDAIERTVLLYRDGLDGSLLTESDTRTTSQLLGNASLRNLRLLSQRVTKRERLSLQRLDLDRPTMLFGGPYFWFSLISQAVSHGVARLIVDYNHHAIPLRELELTPKPQRETYDRWIESARMESVPSLDVFYVTTSFTALHFLDDDPGRDRDVERRFGKKVITRLKRDRQMLFRRIFGTYPLHRRPRDQRVVNLFRFYHRWLAGGRTLLVPVYFMWQGIKLAAGYTRWLARCVAEIRRPRFEVDEEAAEGADFATAVRKIDRMRRPVVESAIALRARVDAEYLGVRLPGVPQSLPEGTTLDDDMRFLNVDPVFAERMDAERQRAERDMVRLGRLIQDGLWDRIAKQLGVPRERFGREHLRAAAAAYLADMSGVRCQLSCGAILKETYQRVAAREPLAAPRVPRFGLHKLFRAYWAEHGFGDRAERRAAWRATVHNTDGVADALDVWSRRGAAENDAGIAVLADLMRHPDRISDQIVTLRAVQTLALIDVLNYREHVYALGNYQNEDPDRPVDLLTLG